MSTVSKIMTELKSKGKAQNLKIYERHGAPEGLFGVSVADLKVIAKKIKGDQKLACDLFDTGNGDAQYLAGIVADGKQMTKKQLDGWANNACWQMVAEYSVPGVVTESEHARDMAMKWIKSKNESVASAGWNTYSGVVTTRSDDELDFAEIKELLKKVEKEIGSAPNRVKYTMNGFVIAVGAYVKPLSKQVTATAKKIGKVDVDMNGTACKVPVATEYIAKIVSSGRAGKKRKTVKC